MNTDMKKWARVHPLREWGRTKTETLQASLPDFCFFSANPSLLGAIRANLQIPWLDFQKNDFAVHDFARKSRGLLSNWRRRTRKTFNGVRF